MRLSHIVWSIIQNNNLFPDKIPTWCKPGEVIRAVMDCPRSSGIKKGKVYTVEEHYVDQLKKEAFIRLRKTGFYGHLGQKFELANK